MHFWSEGKDGSFIKCPNVACNKHISNVYCVFVFFCCCCVWFWQLVDVSALVLVLLQEHGEICMLMFLSRIVKYRCTSRALVLSSGSVSSVWKPKTLNVSQLGSNLHVTFDLAPSSFNFQLYYLYYRLRQDGLFRVQRCRPVRLTALFASTSIIKNTKIFPLHHS